MPNLLYIAEVCLSLPASNAWPERGASAVKRLKNRLRSSLKNDVLKSLMHISINGPHSNDSDCERLIRDFVKKWCVKRKKIAKEKPTEADVSVSDVPVSIQVSVGPEVIQNVNQDAEVSGDDQVDTDVLLAELRLCKDLNINDAGDGHSDTQ